MKRLITLLLTLLLLILPLSAYAVQVADPTDDFYVADYANVLSDEVEGLIVLNNDRLEEACGAQIVVVMVDSISGSTIESYAYTLFNEWGIGSKDKSNGLLLLVAVNDGEYWFMPGMGLQDYLNAGDLDEIANRYFIPSARNGDFDEAMRQMFSACFDRISTAYNAGLRIDETLYHSFVQSQSGNPAAQSRPAASQSGDKEGGSILPFFIIAIIVIIIIAAINIPRRRVVRAPRPPMAPSRPFMGTPHPPIAPRPPMTPRHPVAPRPPVSPRPPMTPRHPSSPRPPMGGGFGGSSRGGFGGGRSGGGGSTRGGGTGGRF